MNKKLMFLFLLILSVSAFAQMPEEQIPSEDQPELMQEPPGDESNFPQMQEDAAFPAPSESPEDYQNTEIIDDPSIEYEN